MAGGDDQVGAAKVIGVVGAGTMGAGIAQLACQAGAQTLLHDPIPEALERGELKVREGLEREASRGRISSEDAQVAAGRLEVANGLGDLELCELVIEAAPERMDLKAELYGALSQIVSEECVLATNTSSLPVTGIAATATHPERVVGMHFFNPAPRMRLLEVIAGVLSGERALALADATGRAMGKEVIRASDGPGFLVNRCNRPFGLEALRLLQERIAEVQTIDRVMRQGGGYPMGPFELSDLVGVDTGFDVSKSFYELSFGEPRWRPSTIQARQVAAGLHGRKSGRGYYDYSGEGRYRPDDPPPPQAVKPEVGSGLLVISGEGVLARELRAAASAAGYRVYADEDRAPDELPALIVECENESGPPAESGGPRLVALSRGSLAALDPAGSSVGLPRAAAVRGDLAGRAHAPRELVADGDRARGALLRGARQARGLGGRRARPRARPHRLPDHQRVRVRARRGRGLRAGHRHGHGARPQPPPRATRVGRPDRPRPRARGARGALPGVPRGALPAGAGAATAGARGAARSAHRRWLLRPRTRTGRAREHRRRRAGAPSPHRLSAARMGDQVLSCGWAH